MSSPIDAVLARLCEPGPATKWLTSPHVTELLARYRREDAAAEQARRVRAVTDTMRLNKLERLIWSEATATGDAISLWPYKQAGKAGIDIQPLLDREGGVSIDLDSLASGRDLRAAIDNVEEA